MAGFDSNDIKVCSVKDELGRTFHRGIFKDDRLAGKRCQDCRKFLNDSKPSKRQEKKIAGRQLKICDAYYQMGFRIYPSPTLSACCSFKPRDEEQIRNTI